MRDGAAVFGVQLNKYNLKHNLVRKQNFHFNLGVVKVSILLHLPCWHQRQQLQKIVLPLNLVGLPPKIDRQITGNICIKILLHCLQKFKRLHIHKRQNQPGQLVSTAARKSPLNREPTIWRDIDKYDKIKRNYSKKKQNLKFFRVLGFSI